MAGRSRVYLRENDKMKEEVGDAHARVFMDFNLKAASALLHPPTCLIRQTW